MKVKKTPSISVVMSVHNNELSIGKSINSIINQTFTDWEMIICDDGSTDNSFSVISEYAKKDSRIVAIKNERNMGLAYSLNRCISIAKSNILARQDADDWSVPNRFEVQYPFVIDHPEYAIVGSGWINFAGDEKEKKILPKEKPKAIDLVSDGGFMHPTWMMRKDIIEKVGFYTVRKETLRSQDYHLMLKLYGIGYSTYNIQQALYYYKADDKTFKRSKNWNRVKGLMWIRWDSYKRNKFPLWAYAYVLKPLIVNLIPYSVLEKYYKKRYYK